MNLFTKTILKQILVSSSLFLLGLGFYWLYEISSIFSNLSDDVWDVEKRIIIQEFYSPDSINKVGVYKYDSGAFGFTTTNYSVIKSNSEYPIQSNILTASQFHVLKIQWKSNIIVEFEVKDGYNFQKEKIAQLLKPRIINGVKVHIKYSVNSSNL